MRGSTIAILTTVLFLVAVAVHATEHPEKAAEAKKAIEAANASISAAVKQQDAKAIAAHYTDDAIALPPDHAMVKGRSQIESFWKESLDGGMKQLMLETVSVERSGGLAVETGTATLKIQPEGKEAQTLEGKYVVVWKHGKDGAWKLDRDIWNMTPPEKETSK